MGSHRRRYQFNDDSSDNNFAKGEKACRACEDFTTWVKKKEAKEKRNSQKEVQMTKVEQNTEVECPLDSVLLGRNTWSYLHTVAAYYPTQPSAKQQYDMHQFIKLFAKFYPCKYCAKDFKDNIKLSPPDVSSSLALSQWFCEQHNIVNEKLGKPLFDCTKVLERWKDGWKDGSCD